MKKKIGVLLVFSFLLFYSFKYEDWGFYGHREIHYYAVMAMPAPVNFYFKEHVEYLSEHAVDPDQRRYAVPDEGARHFIDLDQKNALDRKSTRLNSSHVAISYAVFCLKKKTIK